MLEAKSGSAPKDDRNTDVATSGKNSTASATSKDSNSAKYISTSWTEQLADGNMAKRFYTWRSTNDSDADSKDSSTLLGSDTKSVANARKPNSKAKTSENGVIASWGKGIFGEIINGKAVATTE